MGTIGPRLRAAREARNLTVEQAADDTRISLRFLQALEREEFDSLPAPVYVRGFLRSYANYLGLEPQSLLVELEGENGIEKGSAAYVRGPENPAARPPPRSDPFRPRPVALPPSPGEWDPEPDGPSSVVQEYEEATAGYRPRPVPGVLVERGYDGQASRLPGMVLLGGIGAIVVLVLLIAVVALGGGDDGGGPPAGGGDDDQETSTLPAGGGQTVIVVETSTPATTSEPGGEPATPAPGETVVPTATASGSTNTPPPGATATATVPPTESPTPAATATFTTQPTPSATVQPHPFGTNECTAGGGTSCGDAPYRVICAPDGWFVDKDRDYPKPAEWDEFDVNTTFGINDVAEATCG